MHESNIYIQNHETVKAMGGDINVCLDKYDNAHGWNTTRWRGHSTSTGVPELLSVDKRKLLGL